MSTNKVTIIVFSRIARLVIDLLRSMVLLELVELVNLFSPSSLSICTARLS